MLPPMRSPWRRGRVAIVASVAALGLALGGTEARYGGRALPGTTVLGSDVGGLTEPALRARLEAARRAPVRIVLGTQSVETTGSGSGSDVDVEATTARVLGDGRGVLRDVPGAIAGLVGGRDVDAVLRIDERRLRRTLGRPSSRGSQTGVDRRRGG